MTTLHLLPGPDCCVALSNAAIVNKQLAKHGRSTFNSPAEMADALFDGSSRVSTALQVATALVLIGALFVTVAGVWKVAHGDRGGGALALSGVYGLVGLMAAMGVVL